MRGDCVRGGEAAADDGGGRRLRLLRAHRLIKRVAGAHRYVLAQPDLRLITALLAARQTEV